jgi:hypothetical protein
VTAISARRVRGLAGRAGGGGRYAR